MRLPPIRGARERVLRSPPNLRCCGGRRKIQGGNSSAPKPRGKTRTVSHQTYPHLTQSDWGKFTTISTAERSCPPSKTAHTARGSPQPARGRRRHVVHLSWMIKTRRERPVGGRPLSLNPYAVTEARRIRQRRGTLEGTAQAESEPTTPSFKLLFGCGSVRSFQFFNRRRPPR